MKRTCLFWMTGLAACMAMVGCDQTPPPAQTTSAESRSPRPSPPEPPRPPRPPTSPKGSSAPVGAGSGERPVVPKGNEPPRTSGLAARPEDRAHRTDTSAGQPGSSPAASGTDGAVPPDQVKVYDRCLFGEYLPDGSILAVYSTGVGSHLAILDGRTGEERFRIEATVGTRSALSGNGRVFATALRDGIVVHDVPSLQVIQTISSAYHKPIDIAISEDGSVVVTSGTDALHIYDVPASRLRRRLVQRGGFGLVSMSPDGKRAISNGRVTKYLDLETGNELPTRLDSPSVAIFLDNRYERTVCNADSTRLGIVHVSSGHAESYFAWPQALPRQGKLPIEAKTVAQCMDMSADGKKLVVGCASGQIRIWSLETLQLVQELDGHINGVAHVSFSPQADWVASLDRPYGTLFLWPLGGAPPVAVDRGAPVRPLAPSIAKTLRGYFLAMEGARRDRQPDQAAAFVVRAADLALEHPEVDPMTKGQLYGWGLVACKSLEEASAWVRKYYISLAYVPTHGPKAKNLELEIISAEKLLLDRSGAAAQVIRCCERGASRALELEGPDSAWIDEFNAGKAIALVQSSRVEEAERFYRDLLETARARLAEPSATEDPFDIRELRVSQALRDLLNLYRRQKKHQEALRVCQEIAEMPGIHPAARQSNLLHMAQLYQEMNRLADAEQTYQLVLESGEELPSKGVLEELYRFYSEHKRFDKLPDVVDKLLEADRGLFGSSSRDYLSEVGKHVRTFASAELWDAATDLLDEVRRGWCMHAHLELSARMEAEQILFLRSGYRREFDEATSFAWHRRADLKTRATSAGWVINGKAVRLPVLAERYRLALASSDPEVQAACAELKSTQSQISQLTMQPHDVTPEEPRARGVPRYKLAFRAQQLLRQISVAGWTEMRDEPWVELDEIRKRLPSDSVLVEFARVPKYATPIPDFDQAPIATHYLAWVIPPESKGETELVDLGEAVAIDRAILKLHETVHLMQQIVTASGSRGAADEVNNALKSLGGSVLKPILPFIEEYPHWMLSPEGALWLVPWSGITLDDSHYVVEDHRVTCLTTGRDLVRIAANSPAPKSAVIVADPDFGPSTANGGQGLASLPGTAEEARQVAPLLTKLTGEDVRLLTGGNATEQAVKKIQRPRFLLLSTHGFLFPEIAQQNPLVGCGVALAGANRAMRGGRDADDGLLTGLEIVGMDLRGTELAVLSACETGLGLLEPGEGVAGLRQAFQLAGARAVLATLWSIPDRETAVLMTEFFISLEQGRGHAEAIQTAQKAMIARQRKNDGPVNPFAWAAFTLTGR